MGFSHLEEVDDEASLDTRLALSSRDNPDLELNVFGKHGNDRGCGQLNVVDRHQGILEGKLYRHLGYIEKFLVVRPLLSVDVIQQGEGFFVGQLQLLLQFLPDDRPSVEWLLEILQQMLLLCQVELEHVGRDIAELIQP